MILMMMTTSNLEPIKMQRMLKIMLGDKKMLRLHASKNNTKKTLSFPNNLSLSMAKSEVQKATPGEYEHEENKQHHY
jgi:hypothetical protein